MESGPPLNLREVADHLGIGERALRQMLKEDRFPRPFIVGASNRWWTKDIECWMWLSSRGMFGTPQNNPPYNEQFD